MSRPSFGLTYEEKRVLWGYIEDYLTALTFADAFEFKMMPPRWRDAMKVLSGTWHMHNAQIQAARAKM